MSTQPAPEAPSNLLHVQFKNPEFLSYLSHLQSTGQVTAPTDPTFKFDPAHPLTEHNVMAYFATSPFFDRRSNNEQIRMQNIANGVQNLTGGMGAKQEEHELRRFTGLEFVLVHARAPLCFVVQKRWRTSPTESECARSKTGLMVPRWEETLTVCSILYSNTASGILHHQRFHLPGS